MPDDWAKIIEDLDGRKVRYRSSVQISKVAEEKSRYSIKRKSTGKKEES
jgi:hypothetical protein